MSSNNTIKNNKTSSSSSSSSHIPLKDAGKGSTWRRNIDYKKYRDNFDKIFKKK